MPNVNNNMYKNHSVVPKATIFRSYKGPLYNEAGRICIDLTSKYIPLEHFTFVTQLDNMKQQLSVVQADRIRIYN